MIELLNEAVFHTLVAALVVGALARAWRLREPGTLLALHVSALVVPLVALPVFHLGAPVRHDAWFEEHLALFVGHRWGRLEALGLPLDVLWLVILVTCGLTLFLLDAVPYVRGREGPGAPEHTGPEVEALRTRVDGLAFARGLPPPRVRVLASKAPILFCRGVRRPELVVSVGTLDALAPRELDAALAHELAHLTHRDPGLFWFLWILRFLQCFNPVTQVVVRAAAADAEKRADDEAARTTGDRLSVASSLIKIYRASSGRSAHEPLWGPFVSQARESSIERRCRRLIDDEGRVPVPFARSRVALAVGGLVLLLFFVR